MVAQCVNVNFDINLLQDGILSSSFPVTCGVNGQGGILSPILFNVYVDELIELLRDSGCCVNRTL